MSRGRGERLSRDQERAIAALLTSPTVGDAAASIGVHPNTLRAWTRRPDFLAAYTEARADLLERTVARLQHSTFAVVGALLRDLTHEDPNVRHRAAGLLLGTTVRASDLLNLTRRVAELEARATSPGPTTGVPR